MANKIIIKSQPECIEPNHVASQARVWLQRDDGSTQELKLLKSVRTTHDEQGNHELSVTMYLPGFENEIIITETMAGVLTRAVGGEFRLLDDAAERVLRDLLGSETRTTVRERQVLGMIITELADRTTALPPSLTEDEQQALNDSLNTMPRIGPLATALVKICTVLHRRSPVR